MDINIKQIVSVTDINNNFSKATKIVEKEGKAIVFKNNKPRFIILDFDEYEKTYEKYERSQQINIVADQILDDNLDAFLELAK